MHNWSGTAVCGQRKKEGAGSGKKTHDETSRKDYRLPAAARSQTAPVQGAQLERDGSVRGDRRSRPAQGADRGSRLRDHARRGDEAAPAHGRRGAHIARRHRPDAGSPRRLSRRRLAGPRAASGRSDASPDTQTFESMGIPLRRQPAAGSMPPAVRRRSAGTSGPRLCSRCPEPAVAPGHSAASWPGTLPCRPARESCDASPANISHRTSRQGTRERATARGRRCTVVPRGAVRRCRPGGGRPRVKRGSTLGTGDSPG